MYIVNNAHCVTLTITISYSAYNRKSFCAPEKKTSIRGYNVEYRKCHPSFLILFNDEQCFARKDGTSFDKKDIFPPHISDFSCSDRLTHIL